MLKKVSDLLDAFLAIEQKKLDEQKITHGPTIGSMYEQLTREALFKSLPVDPPLYVRGGFARGKNGKLSDEMDAMLVTGNGEQIPYTEKYTYPVEQVLAVVEVKKTLYQAQIADGYENLHSLLSLEQDTPSPIRDSVERAFRLITLRPVPDSIESLPLELQAVWHMLVEHRRLPVRILFGYHGYSKEGSFREGIVSHMASLVGGTTMGSPHSLPDLIMNRRYCAMKNFAAPWTAPLEEDGWWPVMVSSGTERTAEIFLETIFSRLESRGLVDASVFGEDLDSPFLHRFLDAKFLSKGDKAEDGVVAPRDGWEYRVAAFSDDLAETKKIPAGRWEPAFVSEDAFILANILCKTPKNVVDLRLLGIEPHKAEAAAKELRENGIAGKAHDDENMIHLLTDECAAVILPDGRFAVGENNSGRMVRWLNSQQLSKSTEAKCCVIFDFDGVIADTETLHLAVYNQVFKAHAGEIGAEVVITPASYYTHYIVYGDREALVHMLRDQGLSPSETLIDKLFQIKGETFHKGLGSFAEPLPGVRRVLAWLEERGIPRAICSGARRDEIEMLLETFELGQHFDVMVTIEDVTIGKPEPEGYEKAFRLLNEKVGGGLEKGASLVIEDSAGGCSAGKAAGLRVLGVATSLPLEKVEQHATFAVRDLSHLDLGDLAGWLGVK